MCCVQTQNERQKHLGKQKRRLRLINWESYLISAILHSLLLLKPFTTCKLMSLLQALIRASYIIMAGQWLGDWRGFNCKLLWLSKKYIHYFRYSFWFYQARWHSQVSIPPTSSIACRASAWEGKSATAHRCLIITKTQSATCNILSNSKWWQFLLRSLGKSTYVLCSVVVRPMSGFIPLLWLVSQIKAACIMPQRQTWGQHFWLQQIILPTF